MGRVKKGAAVSVEAPSPETARRSPHTFELVEKVVNEPDKPIDHQLFRNSPLADHPVVDAWKNCPDRFFEDREPGRAILHEKPEHRLAVYLKAQGLSDKEICKRLDYTGPWFSELKNQPWFKLRLVQELKEAGRDALSETIKAAALDSIYTLIDIRDDPTAPKAVRKASADSLLDRYLGKPIQKVETKETRLPTSPEISAIDNELAEVDKQLNQPNGK